VDTEVFVPRDKAESRRALGLPENLPIVLFVGRLDPVKAIPDLLRAVAILCQTMEWRLVLVGEGPERNRLYQLARRLRIAEKVQFVGLKSRCEVSLWMNAADLLALPSVSEGFGLTLAESIACGRPVVATRCGGPEDIVTPEVGRLVPCASPEALSQAIAEVLSRLDSFDPKRLAERARELWTPASVVIKIASVYERCAASGYG
jgi:D-inositol-3-phosphate glycosyltransferase